MSEEPQTPPADDASEARAGGQPEEVAASAASASDAPPPEDVEAADTVEPTAEEQAAEEVAASEEPAADEAEAEPVAEEPPAAEEPEAQPAAAEAAGDDAGAQDVPQAPEPGQERAREQAVTAEVEYVEETPRVKPAIPGADLVPDIVTDGDQFLDAEALAAAEAEAEEAAAREAEDQGETVEATPIAGVAIDLAAGARYTATGKRKSAVARVILKPGTGTYAINGKTLEAYFPREALQRIIRQPLEAVAYESRMDVVARMHGGGVSAQAGALRHGISRALIEADPHLRGELKRRGFLTRDPRVKERKKAGLKKARKRPQFSKR